MSKLLEDFLNEDELTYAFPTPTPKYSKESLQAIPCLYLDTNGSLLEKTDNLLKINGTVSIDVSKMDIKELCSILMHYEITVAVIEDESLLDLPALLLTDIATREIHTTNITITPYPMSRLNYFKNSGIVPVSSTVKPLYCLDSLTKDRLVTKFVNNKLYVSNLTDSSGVLYYSVETTNAIWCLNARSVVTNSKEFISKYIWSHNAD